MTSIRHLARDSVIAGLLVCACCVSTAEAADKELLDILLSNGAITQAQYDRLLQKAQVERADVDEIAVSLDRKGLNVESADGDFAFKIGGRMHLDVTAHSGDGDTGRSANDGSELRRARLELAGQIYQDWGWAAQVDFADDTTSIADFSLSYKGFGWGILTIGHQKQPYSLGLEMSSNDIPFIERGIDNYLISPFVDRAIGVRADAHGEHWYAAGGLFGESVEPGGLFGESDGVDGAFTGDEGWGFAGRYVYAPVIEPKRVLHLGLRAAYRESADNDPAFRTLRIRDQTTQFSNLRIVDTGTIDSVDAIRLFGPEAVWVNGRLSLTGEYNDVSIQRRNGDDLGFDSWHLAATWWLGGESRAAVYRINAGEFRRLTAAEGKVPGTWELTSRYASIDLNDGNFIGGSEDVFTIGANWYANDSVRFLFELANIVRTDESNAIRAGAEGTSIISARVQLIF